MIPLQAIWRSTLPLDTFMQALRDQGYVADDGTNKWIGTARELRALYEFLLDHHIHRNVSRSKFFSLAKATFDIKYKDASSLKFADWDFQDEMERLSDAL